MTKRLRSITSAMLILIVGACAAPPKKEETVFFPPPPAPPRIQYLTFFTGTKNIEEESAFRTFIVGEKEERRLNKPYGVGIYDGKIYVCDTNAGVLVFDLKQKTFEPLKGARGAGKLIQPSNISIASDGTKYVADPLRGQVVVFDRNDAYVRAYGKAGDWKPVDAAPFEDNLYVADYKNGLIKVIDKKSGELVRVIGDKGDPSERIAAPTNIAFDREGSLYVSDFRRFQVVKFDRDGHFLATFGSLGDGLGQFARPRGVALDNEKHLYAVDAAFNNVQIFNKEQQLLLFFGELGDRPGDFRLPAKVVIDYNNLQYFQKYVQPGFEMEYLIIVTSQFGDRRVNVFGYGKEKGTKYLSEEEIIKELQERQQKELEKLKEQQKTPEPWEEPQEKKEPEGKGETRKDGEAAKPSHAPEGK